ncbi:uncharacterized protein METZ01_LOCUS201258 [marine metagenome]|uniref:Uncharacterized protein n=1 Tax=marine metagenome TaxID=408172 RepID=A0A382EEC4_9ZZZZ
MLAYVQLEQKGRQVIMSPESNNQISGGWRERIYFRI